MSALVQITACRLFGAKPLSKPILGYCQLEQTSVKSYSKYKISFHKIASAKWRPFCPGEIRKIHKTPTLHSSNIGYMRPKVCERPEGPTIIYVTHTIESITEEAHVSITICIVLGEGNTAALKVYT